MKSCISLPQRFVFYMQCREQKTVFSVEPPSGVIAPQTSMKLIVTATIDDCLRYGTQLHTMYM